MGTTVEGRRDRKTRETRERIFREAIALFGQKGFADTQIRDIAQRAGVSAVTVHNHFGTKDRILHDLAGLFFAQAMNLFEELTRLAAETTDPGVLVAAARGTVRSWAVIGRQVIADTQRVVLRTATGDRLYRESRARLIPLMENLQRSGIVRSDLAAPVLASMAADLILGALTSWISDLSDTQSASEKAAEVVGFLVATLRAAPRA